MNLSHVFGLINSIKVRNERQISWYIKRMFLKTANGNSEVLYFKFFNIEWPILSRLVNRYFSLCGFGAISKGICSTISSP